MRFAKSLGSVAIALVLAAILTAALPAPAQADGLRAEPIKVMLSVPKAAKSRAAGFDWLAKRRPGGSRLGLAAATERTMPRQIGRGSWICSPAGSGQQSRCYGN